MMNWNGVYPAITTKFTDNDQLDIDKFGKSIGIQVEAGVDGIILGGSLGEASALNEEEKLQLLTTTRSVVAGKVPVIMNIAEQTTKNAIRQAEKAQQNGANGIMLLPPMRYKATDAETVQYFKEVASATDLPVMIYNNPVDYKIMVSLDMFEALASCKNIVAVKDSTRDTTNVTRMINRFGDRFKIFSGVDTLAMESLFLGAHGWVAGLVCAFPHETVAIYRLIKAGKSQEAVDIYRWFLPLLELDINPQLVQNIKLAEVYTGLGSENVRPPRLPLAGKERERVIAVIERALEKRPQLHDYLNLEPAAAQ